MSRIIKTLAVAALVSAGFPALAQRVGPKHAVQSANAVKQGLASTALNAAAGSRTFEIAKPQGFGHLILYMHFTHNNNGAISITCTASDDGNTTDANISRCESIDANGVCILEWAATWQSPSLSADTDWVIDAGVLGYRDMECVVTHGGTPDASDLIQINYDLITQ